MPSWLADTHCLVTGANGFIGAHLVRRLLECGARVTAVVRPGADRWRIANVEDRLDWHRHDFAADAPFAAPHADVVFHLAAGGVSGSADALFDTNARGAAQLFEWVESERVVYVGSCFEYGEGQRLDEEHELVPTSTYAASKAAGTLLARSLHHSRSLDVVCVRPFTAFGPLEAPQRLVPHTISAALSGHALDLTGGEQTRDFIYVGDVVAGMLAAAERAPAGSLYNLCTGEETSVRTLVTEILDLLGHPVEPHFGALPYRTSEMWHLSGDPARAARDFDWRATTSLREGLRQTVQWLRQEAAA